MKFCPKCKTSYGDEFSFCKSCGSSLISKTAVHKNQHVESSFFSDNKYLLPVLILVIVLVLSGFGYYHFNKKVQSLETQVQKQKLVIKNYDNDLEDQKKKLRNLEDALAESQDNGSSNSSSYSLPPINNNFNLPPTKTSVINNSAIVGAVHSSADVEGSYVHGAFLTVDGNPMSCWSEGVSGWGIGEFITISFDDVYEVNGFNIWPGHQKSQDLFYKNGRPSAIRVTANGMNEFYRLHDSMGSQQVRFPYPVRTDSVKIIIADVYGGYKYQDTCIAEISFF